MFLWFLIGIFVAVFCYYQRQRALNLQELLMETSGRLELNRRHVHKIEQESSKLQVDIQSQRALAQQQSNEILSLQKQLHDERKSYEQKLDILGKQILELKTSASSNQESKENITLELSVAKKDFSDQIEKLTRKHAEEITQLQQQISTQKNEALTQALEKDIQDLRRRLSNSEHLYMTMKGLKEMAEERADNWERALAELSKYLLINKAGIPEPRVSTMNPTQLITTALEHTDISLEMGSVTRLSPEETVE